jgi:hypothetical protein
VCVSRFVQSYLQQHGGAAQLGEQRLWVVPLTAWAAFGDDPAAFPDLGARTARQLSAGALQQPVVGMLKLTPEKGSAVLAGCAAALPELRFLAVSGDPAAQQLQRQLLNVSALGPPPPDPACLAARLPAQTARKVRPGRVCPRLLTPQAPAAGAHHAAPGQHRGRAAAHGRRHRPLPLAGGLRHGGGGGDAAGRAGYCQRRRWASCRPAGAGGRRGKGGGGGLPARLARLAAAARAGRRRVARPPGACEGPCCRRRLSPVHGLGCSAAGPAQACGRGPAAAAGAARELAAARPAATQAPCRRPGWAWRPWCQCSRS